MSEAHPSPPDGAPPGPEILMVTATLHVGGAEMLMAAVAQALVRRGWKVSVYALVENGPVRQLLEKGNVRVILPPVAPAQSSWSRPRRMLRLLRAATHLLSILARRRPALVHLFLPSSYVIGAPLAMLAGVRARVVSRLSLNDYQHEDRRYRLFEPVLHRRMSAIIGNSQAIIEQLREDEGAPADRLALIYSGIEADRFEDASSRGRIRSELGLAATTVAFVIVANLIAYKGHADLIRALALAQPRIPGDWHLVAVGRDYGIGEELRGLAEALALQRNISFLGARSDVPEILAACDVGVLSSHQEGFSNAVLEGMAAGLPMIVTDVGGNSEAIRDGEQGIVVPARDPARLAEALIRLAGDAELRSRMGAAARRRLQEQFTLERCADAHEKLYRALLAGGSPRVRCAS